MMKRIIELSENDYKALKEDGVQNHLALADTIIACSMPYKERPEVDLISREALKKELNSRVFQDDYATTLLLSSFNSMIDDAPPVESATKSQPRPLSDLINRSELKKEFEKVYPLSTNEMGGVVNKRIYDIIDNAPAIDISGNEYFPYRTAYFNGVADGIATAVPQGNWIQAKDENGIEIYRKNICSHCKEVSVEKYPFCPNCGAKMKDNRGGEV